MISAIKSSLSGQLIHRKSVARNPKFVFQTGFPSEPSRQTRIVVSLESVSPEKSSNGTIRQTNRGKQVWVRYSQSSKSEDWLMMASPQMNFGRSRKGFNEYPFRKKSILRIKKFDNLIQDFRIVKGKS